MSEQEPQVPDEQAQEEAANLPPPSDPENPAHAPEDPAADTDGPSDDEATGADTAGEPEGDETPPAGEPQPAAPPDTESMLDEVTKGLERAAKNYGKRVADVLGEDWHGLIPCPLCSDPFPGLLTPAPPSEQTVQAVRPIIGLPDLSTYKEDRFARPCDRCNGLGKTLTGSKVPAYATMICNDCKGTGFQTAEAGAAAPVANGSEVLPPPTHVEADAPYELPAAAQEALRQMLAASENAGVAS